MASSPNLTSTRPLHPKATLSATADHSKLQFQTSLLASLASGEVPSATTVVVLLFGVLLLYAILSRSFRLLNNYRLVRHNSSTIPIIIAPWTWQDPLWMIFGAKIAPYLMNIPGFRSWIWCSYLGWTTVDKGQAHLSKSQGGRDLGPAFILVSPSRTEFFTTDPGAAVEVARDWKTYTKPKDLYATLGVFGNNVLNVEGDDWQRHRKITGGAFTREAILGLVWDEARRSAQRLIRRLLNQTDGGRASSHSSSELTMTEVREVMSVLTMHVLSVAAFGKRHNDTLDPAAKSESFKTEQSDTSSQEKNKLSYFDCIQLVVPNIISVIMFGGTNLPTWILPQGIRRIKQAVDQYRAYLHEAISRSSTEDEANVTTAGTDLASMLIKANNAEKTLDSNKGGVKSYLTDEELHGNMFIFSFAGFETTSMALSFTMPYLALDQGIWNWLKEEVDVVIKEEGGLENYEKAFERLVRVRALMYETLRYHQAVAHVPRQTPIHHATSIDIPHPSPTSASPGQKSYTLTIPPNSLMSLPIVIQGYLPELFPDPYVFDPRRFIASTNSTAEEKRINLPAPSTPIGKPTTTAGKETLLPEKQLAPLGFQPWTTGPRVCPGRKFSQVEFVAVVAEMVGAGVRVGLREEIGGVGKNGEGEREKLAKGVKDVVFNLGTRIRREREVGVRFWRDGEEHG